ncbi:MAG: phosphatase PAP2 family protein [Chloroflexi bacterium]|nr:phosphatase PAP2 family protein [Chloroflexota bacterium]
MTDMRESWLTYALAIAAVIGFVVLAAFAASFDRFEGDLWLTQQLQQIDGDAIVRVLDWTEDLSDDPIVIGIWFVSGVAFFLLGGWQPAFWLGLGAVARSFIPLLKEIVGRPRPSADLVEFTEQSTTMSFPSGHATTVVILFGLVFYFSSVYIRNAAARLAVQAACVWLVVVVGLERVHAGQHWPSDVLGGFWFGGLIVAAMIVLHRRFARA